MDFQSFTIDTYEEPPQTTVLRLVGEFDLVCERALQEALDGLCHGSDRSLVVDVSEARFMGVGSLRRIVVAGRGFASTEFRSPVPIVEKVLRLLGFIDGTVGIERGRSCAVVDYAVDVPPMGIRNQSQRIAPANEGPGSWAARERPVARETLKPYVVGPDRFHKEPAASLHGYSSRPSSEQQ